MSRQTSGPTPGPWTQSVDGAIALDGKVIDPDWGDEEDQSGYRPQLEGVIDFDPDGRVDGGFYGFQVTGPAEQAVAIVEWHGAEADAECRANLHAVLAVPQLTQLVVEMLDFQTHNALQVDVRDWVKAARVVLTSIYGAPQPAIVDGVADAEQRQQDTQRLADLLRGLNRGTWRPDRVLVNAEGLARRVPHTAMADIHTIFIRDDWWTLGATHGLVEAARRTWPKEWRYVASRCATGAWVIDDAQTGQAVLR